MEREDVWEGGKGFTKANSCAAALWIGEQRGVQTMLR